MIRYSFDLILKHSDAISRRARGEFGKEISNVKKVFQVLDTLCSIKEEYKPGIERNVLLSLIARYANHVFSMTLLCERGLMLDTFNASRSAIETTAFYWLVCVDPKTANLYYGERSIAPVEIRKMLEKRGIDPNDIKELYSAESEISHVGNKSDNLQIKFDDCGDGKLLVGGEYNEKIQRDILNFIPIYAALFVKYDPDCTVTF